MVVDEGKLMRGFEGLDVGDRVRVALIGTDVFGDVFGDVHAERAFLL
jgi:hypothetical protein